MNANRSSVVGKEYCVRKCVNYGFIALPKASADVSKELRATSETDRTDAMQARRMSESMTAYSTAVGPSSERNNRVIIR